jgi:hypothetical protein
MWLSGLPRCSLLTTQSLFLRKTAAMDIPRSARAPMNVPIGLADGVLIQRAGGDDDLAAAARSMR